MKPFDTKQALYYLYRALYINHRECVSLVLTQELTEEEGRMGGRMTSQRHTGRELLEQAWGEVTVCGCIVGKKAVMPTSH